jgi:hypothetical protein
MRTGAGAPRKLHGPNTCGELPDETANIILVSSASRSCYPGVKLFWCLPTPEPCSTSVGPARVRHILHFGEAPNDLWPHQPHRVSCHTPGH